MEATSDERRNVRVGPQGRVVIPAGMRQQLGIERGDELVARVEEGRMILEKRENVLRRVRKRFSSVTTSESLADELIAERREEARREDEAR